MARVTLQRDAVAKAFPPARRKGRGKRQAKLPTAKSVFAYWFVKHNEKDWFGFNPKFDAELKRRYSATLDAAVAGELVHWRKTPEGRLIEIVVLDQFARQIHRGSAKSFEGDPVALILAQEAVALGLDEKVKPQWRFFFYMPFMHSESLAIHERYMKYFRATKNQPLIDFELAHRDVLARFGRYPFRNAALGRTSTPDEILYLEKRGKAIF